MAHRNMVGGTAYDTTGGRTLVDGTVYGIQKGKTMVDGTVREIGFGPSIVHVYIDGEGHSSNLYATIRGTKYYKTTDFFGNANEFEMEPGEEITAYAKQNKTGYGARIYVSRKGGTKEEVARSSTSSGATYSYVIPSGISELRIELDYDTTLGIHRSALTFYES